MEHWAEMSAAGTVIMDPDETIISPLSVDLQSPVGVTTTHPVDVVEARYPPMSVDMLQQASFHTLYQALHSSAFGTSSRAVEGTDFGNGEMTSRVQNLVVYIGNRHAMLTTMDRLKHDWTFFVRPSRTGVIEEIQIQLVCIRKWFAILLTPVSILQQRDQLLYCSVYHMRFGGRARRVSWSLHI